MVGMMLGFYPSSEYHQFISVGTMLLKGINESSETQPLPADYVSGDLLVAATAGTDPGTVTGWTKRTNTPIVYYRVATDDANDAFTAPATGSTNGYEGQIAAFRMQGTPTFVKDFRRQAFGPEATVFARPALTEDVGKTNTLLILVATRQATTTDRTPTYGSNPDFIFIGYGWVDYAGGGGLNEAMFFGYLNEATADAVSNDDEYVVMSQNESTTPAASSTSRIMRFEGV